MKVDDLSSDQREVFDQVVTWSENTARHGRSGELPILSVGGLAGTGKTTLLGVFAATTTLRCAYAAFTGRAASILTRKLREAGARNVEATTIHRLMYAPILNSKEEVCGWRRRKELSAQFDLIVIDEASMVGGAMLEDLKGYGLPILAVGDHGQLPPVMDSGELMAHPDLVLEKIHRQAVGNPIIQFAHAIRETGRLDSSLADGHFIRFAKKTDALDVLRETYHAAHDDNQPFLDVGILSYRNDTRRQLNGTARKALGFAGPPRKGEVVICLLNEPPVFNGMRGILAQDAHDRPEGSDPWELEGLIGFPDEGLAPVPFTMCAPQFNRPGTFRTVEELCARGILVDTVNQAGSLFDFGYALTVHKSQGSSFRHVIVYLDRPVHPQSPEWRKWAYTAATRASERLTILQ